jgi:hypothetical protein
MKTFLITLITFLLLSNNSHSYSYDIDSNTPYFGINKIVNENNKKISFSIIAFENHKIITSKRIDIMFSGLVELKGLYFDANYEKKEITIEYLDFNGIIDNNDYIINGKYILFENTITSNIIIKTKNNSNMIVEYIEPIFY